MVLSHPFCLCEAFGWLVLLGRGWMAGGFTVHETTHFLDGYIRFRLVFLLMLWLQIQSNESCHGVARSRERIESELAGCNAGFSGVEVTTQSWDVCLILHHRIPHAQGLRKNITYSSRSLLSSNRTFQLFFKDEFLLNALFLSFFWDDFFLSHLFTRDRPHVKECGGGKACGYLAVERADAAKLGRVELQQALHAKSLVHRSLVCSCHDCDLNCANTQWITRYFSNGRKVTSKFFRGRLWV